MRKLWGWLVVGILSSLGFGGITAQATDTAVTTTLPPSMAITGIFNTTSSIANVTNTATLVANNHGLQITEGNNHAGSAWATNNYKVDLSKDATFSLWLYLGKGGGGECRTGNDLCFAECRCNWVYDYSGWTHGGPVAGNVGPGLQ